MTTRQRQTTRCEPDLTVAELAQECQVPEATVYLWNHKGTGPAFYRAGRYVRFRRDDVDRWKQNQLVTR